MKKLLSVVLALVMVFSTAVMLMPTTWATEPEPTPSGGSTRPEGSWVYYEQNFDDATLATKVDQELATAIGWDTALDATQTVMIENGKLRYVSQYFKANSTTSVASTYTTGLNITADTRINSSVTVIEYDLRFQRRAKDTANDIVVSDSKTVKADGQDAQSMMTVILGGAAQTGQLFATNFNTLGTVRNNPLVASSPATPLQGVYGNLGLGTGSVEIIEAKDFPAGTSINVEHSGTKKNGSYEATGFEIDYHVKAVLDPIMGTYYLMVNDVLVSKLADTENYGGVLRQLIATLTAKFSLRFENSVDVLLDNFQIYGYNPSSALVISEVATNGVGVDAAGAVTTGNYQWLEIYNPNKGTTVDVYDYALHVNNLPTQDTSTFGQNADVANDAEITGRGSALGYLKKGAQTFTYTGGTSTFTNPEDGTLAGGQTAILILPEALHAAGQELTEAAVRKDLVKLGMPEDTKIFIVSDPMTADAEPVKYSLMLANEGTMTLGLMKVKNAGTDDVEGLYVGQNDNRLFLLESSVLVTSYNGKNETAYEGFAVHESTTTIPLESVLNAPRKTLEISYQDWLASGSSSYMGFVKFNATEARKNAADEDAYATPGFIPLVLRPSVTFEVYDRNGENPQTCDGKWMASWTLGEDEELACYKFLGYSVDGATELVDVVTLTDDGLKIVPVYERVAPEFVGAQSTEVVEGAYTVRLLGGVNRSNMESVGFKYSYSYKNEHNVQITSEAYDIQCAYVYTAVNVNGTPVTVDEYNAANGTDYEYFFALHIQNIPEVVTEIEFKVTTYMIESKFQTEPICDIEQTVTVAPLAPVAP